MEKALIEALAPIALTRQELKAMNKSDLRDMLMVMFSLVLATLTGFLRQSVIASMLGAGRATDIYLVAFAVPEFIFIALPIVLSPVLMPLFSQARRQAGEQLAWAWGARLSARVMLLLAGLAVCTGLAAPILTGWLSPGFSQTERQQVTALFYPMLPGILLMGLSTLAGSFLQVYRRFVRPVLTTAIYNLAFIAALLWLPLENPLERTGWGVTIGAGAAFLFQLPLFLRLMGQAQLQTSPPAPKALPNLDEAFRLLGWMAAGYGVHHLILFIDRAMATGLGEGAAAVLNFGYHLALVVGQISGLAVSYVVFPTLVESVGARQQEDTDRVLRHALALVLAAALPAAAGLIALREPLVRLLLEHGAFSAQATAGVSAALAIYTLAVTADALCQPLWRLVYARRTGRTVLAVNSVQTMVRLGANLILTSFWGYNGLAWAAVLGLAVQLLLLGWLARSRYGFSISLAGWKTAGYLFLAALAAGLAGGWVAAALSGWLPDMSDIWELLAGGALLLAIYGLFIFPFLKQIPWLRSMMHERDANENIDETAL